MRLYSAGRGPMHRAGGRFSAWTFVQALRTNSPRPASRANPGHRRLALHMSVTTRQRQGAHVAELPCPARGDRRELVCSQQGCESPHLIRFGDAMRAFLLLPVLLSHPTRRSLRRSPGKPHRFLSGGRNHNETCVGCIVSLTTSTRSSATLSRSTSLRSLTLNACRVVAISYFRR